MAKATLPNPQNPKWVRPSEGDLFGSLWGTKNLDLSYNEGRIHLAERTYRIFDSGDDSDLLVPVAFIRTDADGDGEKYFALTQTLGSATSKMFRNDNTVPTATWTEVTAGDSYSNIPTDAVGDMVIFGKATSDRLVISRDDDLILLNNSKAFNLTWWTSTLGESALTTATDRDLHVFDGLLFVPDGNVVHTIDDSLVVKNTRLEIPEEYQIVWVEDDGERVYFGTRHLRGGEALIFPWQIGNDDLDIPLKGFDDETLSATSKNGVLHVINGKGQLLRFNGSDMEIIDKLPVADTELMWEDELSTNLMVHHNGMKVIDGKISILLNGATEGNNIRLLQNQPSGMWVYDDHGLYHKYSLGQYDGSTDDAWGAPAVKSVGALIGAGKDRSEVVMGGAVYTDHHLTAMTGIFGIRRGRAETNRGYFITPKIESSDIGAFWKRLKINLTKLENSTDRVIIKYRTAIKTVYEDNSQNTLDMTWVDGDTFSDSGSFANNLVVGEEVEVVCGDGDGAIAHISSISGDNFTLDESIPGISNGERARGMVQNWTKLGTISSQTLQKDIFTIAKRAPWIQFKVELRGAVASPEVQKIITEFNPSKR